MAIEYRILERSIDIRQIPAEDPVTLPDIIAPSQQRTVPAGFATEAPIFATKAYTPLSTPSSPATTSSQSSATAAPTQSAAASSGGRGLSHGAIVAIVVPIGVLAILIPFLVLLYLNRRYRVAAEKRASQRSSKEAILQKQSSIQRPQPKGPKPARPDRTPRRSVVDLQEPERRDSLGLFNFELSPSSTPGMGWMTPNPRFSIARALQMRRSQPSIVQSQPHASRAESDRPRTRDSEPHQTVDGVMEPPPPYVNDTASPKPTLHFAPLNQIGTLQHVDRPHGPTMQPTMAPTLPPIAVTNGALNVSQPKYTPRHTPRPSSEILQLPDVYGRAYSRSPSPSPSMRNGSNLNRPFSYIAPERNSDVSSLSDEPEPWRGVRDSNLSSIISPIDNDESSTIHPHQVL